MNIITDALSTVHFVVVTIPNQCIKYIKYNVIPTLFYHKLDSPEIEVERPFVHTGVGYEAQLICIVHAEPAPHVIWYKETTQLGTTEQHSQQVRHICDSIRNR